MTEDEMVGWHHQLDGHEFEQAPGVGNGQGNLACCSPWGRKESDTNERVNWTDGCCNKAWMGSIKHQFTMLQFCGHRPYWSSQRVSRPDILSGDSTEEFLSLSFPVSRDCLHTLAPGSLASSSKPAMLHLSTHSSAVTPLSSFKDSCD